MNKLDAYKIEYYYNSHLETSRNSQKMKIIKIAEIIKDMVVCIYNLFLMTLTSTQNLKVDFRTLRSYASQVAYGCLSYNVMSCQDSYDS